MRLVLQLAMAVPAAGASSTVGFLRSMRARIPTVRTAVRRVNRSIDPGGRP